MEDPTTYFSCRHSLNSHFKLPAAAGRLLYMFFCYVNFMIGVQRHAKNEFLKFAGMYFSL